MSDPAGAAPALMRLDHVRRSFRTPDGGERMVLDGVDLTLSDGEIVALLGKSGSGKSTLLRIMAGLIRPSGGTVSYRGRPMTAPARGIAMVFQSFALFPWLTVRENVELGMEAQGVPGAERAARAEAAIDLIGLGGFEEAYPKELSGGMRQRVGFARALVMNPEILLLDEPFSALDVLTAETLRTDLVELWRERRIPTKAILIVSHNIEEAVLMADRILIFDSDPGRVRVELPVKLDWPRAAHAAPVRALVDEVYGLMTAGIHRGAAGQAEQVELGYRLPEASINAMAGLLELLTAPPFSGHADLPRLADVTGEPDDVLFPLFEGLRLLGFARVAQGDIILAPSGRAYAEADAAERTRLFREALLANVPLARRIRQVLDERADHRAPEERFLQELQDHIKPDEAERVLAVAIAWGRHAEAFAYDYDTGLFELPEG